MAKSEPARKVWGSLLGDFGSHPTEQDLIMTYLRPRVDSGDDGRDWGFIHSANVYSDDPAELTRRFRPAISSDGEKAWYFFTLLRGKPHGQRKERMVGAAGEGCWRSDHAMKSVLAGIHRQCKIGSRQSFAFCRKLGTQRIRSGWLMVEIRLNADERSGEDEPSGMDKEKTSTEIVLCKVYRSPRAKPEHYPMKPSSAAAFSGRKREADDGSYGKIKKKCLQCPRCGTEIAESESRSDTADDDSVTNDNVDEDKPQGRSDSGVLEDVCSMSEQPEAPHRDETADSSETRGNYRAPKFYDFLH